MAGSLDCRREYSRTHMTKHIGRRNAVGNLDSLVIKKIDTLNFVVHCHEFLENQIQAIEFLRIYLAYEPVRQDVDVPRQAPADSERIKGKLLHFRLKLRNPRAGSFLQFRKIRCRTRHRKTLKKVDSEQVTGADFFKCFNALGKTERAGHLGERMNRLENGLSVRIFFNVANDTPVNFNHIGMDLDKAVNIGVLAAEVVNYDKESRLPVMGYKFDKFPGRKSL